MFSFNYVFPKECSFLYHGILYLYDDVSSSFLVNYRFLPVQI